MAQSVTAGSAPVELHHEYDQYGCDLYDQTPAAAPATQHSDTLGASSSASPPPPALDLGSPKPASVSSASARPLPPLATYDLDPGYDHQQEQAHEQEQEPQHRHRHQRLPSQEPLVSPSQSQSQAQSQLPPIHEAQGHGRQPLPPYRSESAPLAHARSPPLQSPRNTRSHSVAASLASVGSQSSIRRKPLSPTASPLAVRFSSRLYGFHTQLHDLQQPPDSGYYSLDSPDLYDLSQSPTKPEHAPAPPSVATPSLSTPLEEQSDEDE